MAEITVREFELALKHCYMTRCNCPKCPIHNVQDCFQFITKTAYEIIISQEAQIEKYKSANISPVRHGYWVEQSDCDELVCSCCNGGYTLYDETPYCSNCGAKMDGKEREKMTERERLIELLMQGAFNCSRSKWRAVFIADYLLANGVRVPPVKAEEAENALKEREENA